MTVGPFEVWGFPSVGEGSGTKSFFLVKPRKENMSQMHDFGNLWVDLCTFWSDFRMQNHDV